MITRYQRNAALYAEVLENPLILHNIFQHLEANDALNVVITNAPFTKEQRFEEVLTPFLEEKKENYKQRMEKKRDTDCITTIRWYLDTTEITRQQSRSIDEVVTHMCGLFDHLVENMWFLEKHPEFARVVEDKIVDLLFNIEFTTCGLQYMRLLFNVTGHVEFDENDEEFWFVVTSYGEKVYF